MQNIVAKKYLKAPSLHFLVGEAKKNFFGFELEDCKFGRLVNSWLINLKLFSIRSKEKEDYDFF